MFIIAFLHDAAKGLPFRLTHVQTDGGSCSTPPIGGLRRAGRRMVERFNGRVGREVLGITIWSHAQLEQLLRDFDAAYNARRQGVLDGKAADQVVAERFKTRRKLAHAKPEKPEGLAGPEEIAQARLIAEAAKKVSRPDGWATDGFSAGGACPLSLVRARTSPLRRT